MDNFDLKKYLAEGRLFEEDFKNPILDKYLELKKSVDNNTAFEYELSDFINDLDNTEREGLESDLGLERDELYEGRLLKEDNLKDYWSEWAAGEIKVGNDTVGVEFGDADDEAMGVFKDYVKAVKALNADSKELRNDIAGAVSTILYDGGDFEDYSFNVLTADQYTKIQDII
jgi:hypothetical protein